MALAGVAKPSRRRAVTTGERSETKVVTATRYANRAHLPRMLRVAEIRRMDAIGRKGRRRCQARILRVPIKCCPVAFGDRTRHRKVTPCREAATFSPRRIVHDDRTTTPGWMPGNPPTDRPHGYDLGSPRRHVMTGTAPDAAKPGMTRRGRCERHPVAGKEDDEPDFVQPK